MSRKKCIRRKVWILPQGITPFEYARYQAALLTIAEWNEQVQPVVVAIEQLSMGHWDPHIDWQPLFMCLNRIESMLTLKKANDNGLIAEAQEVFVAALDRQSATGAKSFKANELQVLREIGQVYGDLLKEITHKQLQEACQHTDANIQRITRQGSKNTHHAAGCLIERKPSGQAA